MNNTGLDLSFLDHPRYTITDSHIDFYVDEETGEHRVSTEVHWLEDGVPGMISDDRLQANAHGRIFPAGIRVQETDLSSILLPASNTMTHNREYYNYLGERVDAEVYTRANETAQATTEWYGDLADGPYWIFNYVQRRYINRVYSSMYHAGPSAVEFSPNTITFTPITITRDKVMHARYDVESEQTAPARFIDLETELRMVLGRYTGAPNSSETRERIRLEIAHVLEKHGVGRTSIDVHGTAVVGEIEVTITPEAGESAWRQRQSPYFWKEEAEKREIEEEMAKLEKIEINEDVF